MAVPFLNSITLNKNEVQDFKVYNIGTGNPTLSSGGDIGYFWTDTTGSASARVLKWWDGSNVRTLLDSSSTTVVAADLSGGAAGSLPYQQGASDTTFLGIGTAGQVLSVASGVPAWVNQSSLAVGSATTATTADKVANALTAGTYLTSGGTFDGSTARTFAVDATDANTASKVVARDGSGNFSAGTITASLSGNASTATNVSGGAAGQLLYQSGLATTAKLGVGTDGYILTYDGTNTKPKWSASIPSGSVSGLAASATTDTTNAANITSGLLPLARLALANGQFYVGNASNNPVATAKSSIPLSGFGALTADLDIAGFNIINSGNVTSGSAGSTLATKGYVDSVAQGLDVKGSCKVASTVNITLSAPGSITIDGVSSATFTSGTTRILVKDQSAQAENGIYVWNGTGSAMTRASDADTWEELVGAFTFVEEGTANADSGWVCTANAGGTLGTTAVTWTKFSQAGSYTAGNGMVLSGGVFHFAQSSAYTAGQIPFASSTSAIGFSSNLFWDNGNSRLGIGTASPNLTLSVAGDIGSNAWIGRANVATPTADAAMYRAADNTIAFSTANVERLRIDSSGRLGIGTASPSVDLEVGDSTGTRTVKISGNTSILNLGYGTIRSGPSVGDVRILSDRFRLYNEAGSQIALNVASTGATDWYTSGSLKMSLDSSGNLGLGVTPSTANTPTLQTPYGHIAGVYQFNALANAYYNGGWKYTNTGVATVYRQDAGVHSWCSAASGSAGATVTDFNTAKMTLDASGNLGVGVTTVGERIHASGNIKAAGTAGTFPRFISEVGAKSWATGYRSGTTSFEIWEDSTTRLAIANGGQIQVGINGTTSAPAITLGANTDTGIYWPTNSDTLALAVGGSDAIYIDSSRNVGIGTATPANKTQIQIAPTATQLDGIRITDSTRVAIFGSTGSSYNYRGIGANEVAFYANAALNLVSDGSVIKFTAGSGGECLRIKTTGQLNLTGLNSAPTGAVGDLYYNSTSNTLQYHNNSAFQQLSRKYTVALNDGSVTVSGNAYTITHNMGSKDITVSVRRTTDDVVVFADVSMPSTTTATVTFAAAITAANYVVTVIG
jgi:hypothetical protein